MRLALPLLTALALLPAAAGAQSAARPEPDREALREAASASHGGEDYASSASYAHFLNAQLAQAAGNDRRAVDELRLALATDDEDPFLLTELAAAYARLGELTRAERELRRVLERTPRSAPAHLLMGRVLLERGRLVRAAAHLRRAIALRPRETDAYLVLIQLHLEAGRLEEAERVAEELGAALPGEPVAYRRLGLVLADRGQAVAAARLLRKAVARDPGDVEAWRALARLAEEAGRLGEAEEALSRALERDPDQREVLLRAGELALRQESATRARAYFDRLLGLSEEPELAVRVAVAWLGGGQPEAAAEVLEAARQGRAREPRLAFYAGLVQERLRRFSRAADAYAAVPPSSSLHAEAQVRRGLALSRGGAHVQALLVLREQARKQPEAAHVTVALSRALERSGAGQEAERVLTHALQGRAEAELVEGLADFHLRRHRPREAVRVLEEGLRRVSLAEQGSLRLALAGALEQAGQVERALRLLREQLAVEPDHAPALNFLGYTLADSGRQLEEAERLVRRALALEPDSGAYQDSLGWVLYRRGDLQGAREWLEKAVRREPGEPVILEHLGDVYVGLGRAEEARGVYARALELLRADPELASLQRQREGLEGKLKKLSTAKAGR